MAQRIVVLTGAGISAESGVNTFRDNDGLWENHRLEDVATPQAFERNPQLVQRFYNERRAQLAHVKPNAAHSALAEFEQEFLNQPGHEFLLVTQNVDNLHERAGSRNLRHMHGELTLSHCLLCGNIARQSDDITEDSQCPSCNAEGLRPHIVWFGEMPLYMEEIYNALEQCDLFISIGTSGHVYPAAGFVDVARQCGATTIEINPEPSQVNNLFDQHIQGKAGTCVPQLCHKILLESPLL